MVLRAITTYRRGAAHGLKGDPNMESRNLGRLPPFDKASGALNIIVETPENGRIKYKYNEKYAMFRLDKTLPDGFSFPFEFGFVPSTIGGDGDPLDVLVQSDEATFPGYLVLGQVLGVVEAEQREGKQVNRNDQRQDPGAYDSGQNSRSSIDLTHHKMFHFVTTKRKARHSNPWVLAAASVLWIWSKRPENERARREVIVSKDSAFTLNTILAGMANRDAWTSFYPRSNTPTPECNQRIAVCGPRTPAAHARSIDAKIESTYFVASRPSNPARFWVARPFGISPDVAII
jgi:hypothetical protein